MPTNAKFEAPTESVMDDVGLSPYPDPGAAVTNGNALAELFQRVVQELAAATDLLSVTARFRDLLLEFTGADRAGLIVFDPHGVPLQRELLGAYDSDESAEEMFQHVLRDGLAGRAMRTRQGFIRQSGRGRSLLIVPLLFPTRVIGLVSLWSKNPEFFSDAHLELVSAVSRQAVTFVENARLSDLARRRQKEMGLLTDLAVSMSKSLSVKGVMTRALQGILEATEFDMGQILTLSDQDQELVPQVIQWRGQEARSATGCLPCPVGRGATGRALELGQVVYVEDIQGSMLPLLEPYWAEIGMHALASIPIRMEGVPQGVISLGARVQRSMDRESCDWLQAMADLVGMALANARLYEGLEEVVKARTQDLAAANRELESEVAERARAAEALRQERDLVALLMETTPVGMLQVSSDGRITFANHRAEEILGLSRVEITQRTYNAPEWKISDLQGHPVPEEELPFRRVIETARPIYGLQHAIESPDGGRVLLSISGAPVFRSDEVAGGVFAIEDVTAAVEAGQALEYRVQFEHLMAKLATQFVSCAVEEIDACIREAMAEIARLVGVERAYIISLDGQTVRESLEWNAPGVSLAVPLRPGDSVSDYAWGLEQLEQQAVVHIPDVDQLPDAQARLREVLQARDVKTSVFFPLMATQGLAGLLALDSVGHKKRWDDTDLALLMTASAVLTNALVRKETMGQIAFQARLLDSVRESIVASDEEGRVTYWSKGAEALYGYTQEEVLGRVISFIVPEGQEVEEEARIRHVLETGSWAGQYVQVRKDGGEFWADAVISLVRGSDGQPLGLIGIDRDITERVHAEGSLRASEERWRSLMENAPDYILTTNREGVILSMNRSMRGRKIEEVIGTPIQEHMTAAARIKFEECLARVLGTGELCSYETRSVLSGEPIWYINRMGPVWEDNQIVGVTVISTNISERVQAENALRASEEKWRSLVENAPDYIATLDRGGRVQFVNRAPAGTEKELLLGAELLKYVPAHSQDLVRQAADAVFERGEAVRIEISMGPELGGRGYAVRAGPVWDNGRVVEAILVVTDITDRIEMEEALRASERRQRALLNAVPDMLVTLNRDGTYLTVRPAPTWRPLLAPDELVGKRLEKVLPPDVVRQSLEATRRALETGEIQAYEYQLQEEDGPHDYESRMVRSGEDEVLAIVRDITEKKKTERDLRASEEQNRALVEAIPDLLGRIRRDGTVLDFRPARDWEPLRPAEEIAGTCIYDTIPPELAKRRMEYVRRALDTGKPQSYEYHIDRDGERFYYETRVVASGPDETLSMVRDITVQRRAQESLRLKDASIAASISPMAMATVDGRVTYANRAFLDLWGYDREEEVLGLLVPDFCEDPALVRERLGCLFQQGYLTAEDVGVRKDGSKFDLSLAVTLVDDENGEPVAIMASFLDVTARNRAERELAQRANELALLNEIAALLAGSLDPERVLESALAKLGQKLRFQGGAIFLLDESGTRLHLSAYKAKSGSKLPQLISEVSLGEGLAGRVALERTPFVLQTADYPNLEAAESLKEEGIVVTVGVPILSRDRVIGVLNGASYEPRVFSDQELKLMATIGAQIGPNIESAHLYKRLRQAHQSLRALGAKLSDTLEGERIRLSRELHDDIGQILTALKLTIQMARGRAESNPSRTKESLDHVLELVDDALRRVRALAVGLRPASLEVQSLVLALRDELNQFARHNDVEIDFEAPSKELALSDREELALFRIVQEALTNVSRHAQASQVTVCLEENRDALKLVIKDDGVGFNAEAVWASAAKEGHLGLVGMRERAELIGAELRLDSRPGEGTRLIVLLPILEAEENKWKKSA